MCAIGHGTQSGGFLPRNAAFIRASSGSGRRLPRPWKIYFEGLAYKRSADACRDSYHEDVIASVNPATGETLRVFDELSEAQLEEKLERAERAFRLHRRTRFGERARWLTAAAGILETEQDRIGRIMTREMGKPIGAARAEAAKCALACRYYAEHGGRLLADEVVKDVPGRAFVRYQPIGPVLAVMPWNFPFWQVFRFAAPALMAGDVGLLKHAANVPDCALAIEEIFRHAGFPEGVFQTLLIDHTQLRSVIRNRAVKAVTLTGSTAAGRAVA